MEEEKNIEQNAFKRFRTTFLMYGIDCLMILIGIIYATEITNFVASFKSSIASKENLYIFLIIYFIISTVLAHKAYSNYKKLKKEIMEKQPRYEY